jgi:hypothetical protein
MESTREQIFSDERKKQQEPVRHLLDRMGRGVGVGEVLFHEPGPLTPVIFALRTAEDAILARESMHGGFWGRCHRESRQEG